VDVDKEVRQAVDTGKVVLGADKSIKAVKLGQAKLVILASNCEEAVRADLVRYAGLAGIHVYNYAGDSAALGLACGKPFFVSVMAVVDPGGSSILGIKGG